MLQEMSEYEVIDKDNKEYKNFVKKSKMPVQGEFCRKLNIKSPKTFRSHFNYLIEKGYIVDGGDKYILPEMENIYFLIPLNTIRYINDNCKEHVYKIYIYLGQRYKWAIEKGFTYEFTLEELGEHIGLKVKNHTRGYEIVNNALLLLQNSGLIEYTSYFNSQSQKKKLIKFSFDYKTKGR